MGCVIHSTALQTIYLGYSSKEQSFSGIHDQNTDLLLLPRREEGTGKDRKE